MNQPTTPVVMSNPIGRPTKFTPETRDRIITALRAGNYRETACHYAGISFSTFRNWIVKAEAPDAPADYVEFLEAIERAEAEAEMVDIGLIRQAAQGGSWQAAAWVRERKNPERWGRRDRSSVELSGPDGGPVQVGVGVQVDVSAIEGLAAILEQRALAAAQADADVLDVDPVD